MGKIDEFDNFHPLTRDDWRRWLHTNHDLSPGIWFVFFKKHTGKPRVTYDELVQEALCFGWIDSLGRKFDDERSKLLFTPRKPKSVWSKPNKERVAAMIASGLMTEVGLEKIKTAKKDGSWDALNSSDNLEMPDDLMMAFAKNKKALENFEGFTASARKMILYWLGTAKRDETRNARLAQIVSMAGEGLRANLDTE